MIRRNKHFIAALWLGLIGCTAFGQESPLFEKRTVLAPKGQARAQYQGNRSDQRQGSALAKGQKQGPVGYHHYHSGA